LKATAKDHRREAEVAEKPTATSTTPAKLPERSFGRLETKAPTSG